MMICSSGRSWRHRELVAHVLSKFLAGLVETDGWTGLVVRVFVKRKDCFHSLGELYLLFGRNIPVLRAVWLQVVF